MTDMDGSMPPEVDAQTEPPVSLRAAEQTAAEPGEAPPPQSTCTEAILACLGHCADAGPQSAASIIAVLKAAGFAENTIEVGLHRPVAAGQSLLTFPGPHSG